MPKNHLKTQQAPKTWPIKRKNVVFTTRPNPGAHNMNLSMPINIVLRNLLNKAQTNKEVKKILHDEEVLVDGKRRKDYRYPVGLMDVISLPKIKEHYRILINDLNRLYAQSIDNKEANFKLSKITNKKQIKGNKTQLLTMDGRTIIVTKDNYKTRSTLVLELPKQLIKNTIALEKGVIIILYAGKYVGKIGTVIDIEGNILKFKDSKNEYKTKTEYAIVIGKDKSEIKIAK